MVSGGVLAEVRMGWLVAVAEGVFYYGGVCFCVADVCSVFGVCDRLSGVCFLAVCCCFSSLQQLLLCFSPPWHGCILVPWCVPFWFGFLAVPAWL